MRDIKTLLMASCLTLALASPALAEDMGAMTPEEIKHEHGGETFHMFRLETDYGANKDGGVGSWDWEGWVGTDENKLWLKSEGEYADGKLQEGEAWALYSRNIATFWDAQAGTDVAVESADVVLMSGSLQGVPNAIALSKATIGNIRQNLFWAFGYNTALIPVAAGALYPAYGILLSPIFAAGAMAMSSVFVLGNALRLRRFQPPMAEQKQ